MKEILALAILIIVFALTLSEYPPFFREASWRFLLRSGLLLYSRTFKVKIKPERSDIPRWKIEHWMAAFGFWSPMAEKDGENRYLLKEFFYLMFRPFPMLLRAKITWNIEAEQVTIRGYATWPYFLMLIFWAVISFFLVETSGNLCAGVVLISHLVFCLMMYLYQMPRLSDMGEQVAGYLSGERE